MRNLPRVAIAAAAILAASMVPAAAAADDTNPLSLTLYGGPATNQIFTDVIAGRFHWSGGLVAIAGDRRLAYLGWGWTLVAEGQLQQFTFGHNYNSVALGLGLEFHHFPWNDALPTAISFFTGPSYSANPPQAYPRSQWGSKKNLLNYVGLELAVTLPEEKHWDVVIRIYHRSGMWGVYTLDPDEVSSVGLGLRYRL